MPRDNGASKKGGKAKGKNETQDNKKGKGRKSAEEATAAKAIVEPEKPEEPEKTVGDGTPNPDYPQYRVERGKRVRLKNIDPEESGDFDDKEETLPLLQKQIERIDALQERLFAEGKQSLLIVLQAMDTGGKDGTIRGVFEGVNPQGCHVWGFKAPTPEELAHDFLWRIHQKTPGRGMITIFNRSHYEDVLVVRVHDLVPEEVWKKRYAAINEWERIIRESGTVILKFYLHISKDEQKQRLEERRDTPEKRWKFAVRDLGERAYWDDYMQAYEDAINKCSTEHAPWYVIPANKKWYRNLVIARIIADALEAMDPQFPQPEEGIEGVVIPD
jgi:PPK2 family polyphosphate:nucleotide phosphotransferase